MTTPPPASFDLAWVARSLPWQHDVLARSSSATVEDLHRLARAVLVSLEVTGAFLRDLDHDRHALSRTVHRHQELLRAMPGPELARIAGAPAGADAEPFLVELLNPLDALSCWLPLHLTPLVLATTNDRRRSAVLPYWAWTELEQSNRAMLRSVAPLGGATTSAVETAQVLVADGMNARDALAAAVALEA